MVRFNGAYLGTLIRDEVTGYTRFTVKVFDEALIRNRFASVLCEGNIPRFPLYAPLEIWAEEESIIWQGEPSYRYMVRECRISDKDQAAALSFISGPYFKGLGPKKAEKILSLCGGRIFEAVKDPGFAKALIENGIPEKNALSFIRKVSEFQGKTRTLYYIVQRGGTYENAEALYERFGEDLISEIEKDPYQMQLFGLPYSIVEKAARDSGVRANDMTRLRAIVLEAFRLAEGAGNTAMTFSSLMERIRQIEERANMGYVSHPFYVAASLFAPGSFFKVVRAGGEDLIYRLPVYESEKSIGDGIFRLLRTSRLLIPEEGLPGAFHEALSFLGPEQMGAVDLIRRSGVSILTGAPGTGKTTVVNSLINALHACSPALEIFLCAPTASAAKRLREKTGRSAMTIHKMLGIQAYGEHSQAKNEYDQLPYDVIIVDEASMVGVDLMARLIKAVKNGALILLVGDTNQFPSIDPGNVLYDCIKAGVPYFSLTKRYRQEGNSIIKENSDRILLGDSALEEDSSYMVIKAKDTAEMKELARKYMAIHYDPASPYLTRLYTPVRNEKYEVSSTVLNREFHDIYGNKDAKELVYGGTTFSVGDPVIFTRNNYEYGYINGDEGVITDVSEGSMEIRNADGEYITVDGLLLGDVDLAYCLTAYKSQGAECDTSIVLVPAEPSSMLERRLPYVTGTRARKMQIFITENGALKKAIETDRAGDRKTGLSKFLLSLDAG